jgi:hypothetical protein
MDWVTTLVCTASCLCVVAPKAHAQAQAVEVPALVDRDTTWQGLLRITHDVTISDATVRVAPGSVIEFAPDGSSPARIILNGGHGSFTGLLLEGTEEMPITVTTVADGPPASIIVPPTSGRRVQQGEPPALPHGSLVATHTVFKRLGDASFTVGTKEQRRPAIHLQLIPQSDTLSLVDCRFENCGPILANFVGQECRATIQRCRFRESRAPTAVELYGTGVGEKVLSGNFADAGFRILASSASLTDNVLVGEHAALVVEAPEGSGCELRDNYVHNTTDQDLARFCLTCTDPQAAVTGNLLRGGTWVVQNGTRQMQGNVLVGKAGLLSPKLGVNTTTHQLISAIPDHAEISANMLLGPAYSHLVTSAGCREPVIRNNVFDGGGVSARGVHLNALANEKVRARIERNVFAGFRRAAIYDEAHLPESVASCRGNVFADTDVVYDLAGGACAPEDPKLTTRHELGYPPLDRINWERIETSLTSGQASVPQAIALIKSRYRLPPDPEQATKTP